MTIRDTFRVTRQARRDSGAKSTDATFKLAVYCPNKSPPRSAAAARSAAVFASLSAASSAASASAAASAR
eukprot:2737995-Prymnesium_polylepis.1